MSFYCSVCNIQFADSHAAESHKASLRHKKRSGEAAREAVLYKKDEEVTVEDVMGLMRRKAQELGLQPWRELRYNPPGCISLYMEEAVYGDVLDVLVELREAVRVVVDAHSSSRDVNADSPKQPISVAVTACLEQSPAFLEKLNTLTTTLETVLSLLADSNVAQNTALALRTLVTRKLGDIMESAHHVRSLTQQAVENSQSASMLSAASSSTASSEHRASEALKARQVFRTASQNLDDAQRLLRIAYPSVLSTSPKAASLSSSAVESNKHTGAVSAARTAPGATTNNEEAVRYSLGSNRSGTGTTNTNTTDREESPLLEERNAADTDGASVPRASDHTAPYTRRSESRAAAATTGSPSPSVARDDDATRRGSWGSSNSSAEARPPSSTAPPTVGRSTAPPSAVRDLTSAEPQAATGTQWWFDPADSSASNSERPTPHPSERKVSFTSLPSSEDSSMVSAGGRKPSAGRRDSHDTGDDVDLPIPQNATLRYRERDDSDLQAASAAAETSVANMAADAPIVDLAYFQSSSPTAAAGKAAKPPQTALPGSGGGTPAGLPPKPPTSSTATTPTPIAGGLAGARLNAKTADSLTSSGKLVVNPDGTLTTRHTQRLPGDLWRHIIDRDVSSLRTALKHDVMDLFNYGEETPQVVEDNISDVSFSYVDGIMFVNFSLAHRASLSGTDIDLRLAIFSFPEMTALYEDHFVETHRRELLDEPIRGRGDAEDAAHQHVSVGSDETATTTRNETSSTSDAVMQPSNLQSALAGYRWPPSSQPSTPSMSRANAAGHHPSDAGGQLSTQPSRGSADSSSASDRTVSVIPENSPMNSLTPTSAAALRRFHQRQNFVMQPQPAGQSHTLTIPGRHWDKVVEHLSERVCRLLVVDEIASALKLASTSVEHVEFRFGSLIVDYDLFAGPGETLPPSELVDKIMSRCQFPVMRRVYDDTCRTLALTPEDPDEATPPAAAPATDAKPAVQFTLPDKSALDCDSDEESIRRRRIGATAAKAAPTTKPLPEPATTAPVPSPAGPVKTVTKAPPLMAKSVKAEVRKPVVAAKTPEGRAAATTAARRVEDSLDSEAVQEPRPQLLAAHAPEDMQERSNASSYRTPVRYTDQHQLLLTPMDDEPTTLLHLSLMHDVPLSVLREWNPQLADYGNEEPIPESIDVTVPRGYGLEDEYNDEDIFAVPADYGEGHSVTQPPSALNRSRGSTGTTRSSAGGNIRFIKVQDPTAPPTPPPLSQTPDDVAAAAAAAAATHSKSNSNANADGAAAAVEAGTGSGTSTPTASPRDWEPKPASPPDAAVLSELRRSSEGTATAPGPKAADKQEEAREPPTSSTVATRKPVIRVLGITPTEPEQQQQQQSLGAKDEPAPVPAPVPAPTPSPRPRPKFPKFPMPPPLNVATSAAAASPKAAAAFPQDPTRERSPPRHVTPADRVLPTTTRARRQPHGRKDSHDTATAVPPSQEQDQEQQQQQETDPLTSHQQRMLKAQPPPLSAALVDRRKSSSTTMASLSVPSENPSGGGSLSEPPKDVLAAAVEQEQEERVSAHNRAMAAAAAAAVDSDVSPPPQPVGEEEKQQQQQQQQQQQPSQPLRPQLPVQQPRQQQPYLKPPIAGSFRPIALQQPIQPRQRAPQQQPEVQEADRTAPSVGSPQLPSRGESVSAVSSVRNDFGGVAFDGLPMEQRLSRRAGLSLDPSLLTVTRVRGPALEAGFQLGDAIRTVDGKAVRSYSDFVAYVTNSRRQAVFVTVQEANDGPVKTRHVTLADPNTPVPAESDAGSAVGSTAPSALTAGGASALAEGHRPLFAGGDAPRRTGHSSSLRFTPRTATAQPGSAGRGVTTTAPTGRPASVGASVRYTRDPSTSPVPPPRLSPPRDRSSNANPESHAHVASSGGAGAPVLVPSQSRPRYLNPSTAGAVPTPATIVTSPPPPAYLPAGERSPTRSKIRSRSANPSAVTVPLGPARAAASRSKRPQGNGSKTTPNASGKTGSAARK